MLGYHSCTKKESSKQAPIQAAKNHNLHERLASFNNSRHILQLSKLKKDQQYPDTQHTNKAN
jgi:hypothetical protein